MLDIGERSTDTVVEDCTEKFVVLLVEAVQTYLQIVLRHIRRETHLSPTIS